MKYIKVEPDGSISTLIQSNDPSMVLSEGYIDVTERPELHDIEKINAEFKVELKKDADGNVKEVELKQNTLTKKSS